MNDHPAYKILVVEDDGAMRKSLVELLDAAGWSVSSLARANQVARHLINNRPDVILSDVQMPGMTGVELQSQLAGTGAPPLVLISAHGDIAMAVQTMQAGAYSFVEKPYEPRRLLAILKHAAEQNRMRESNTNLRNRLLRLSGLDQVLLGQSQTMKDLKADILDLASGDVSILVLGETGSGKDVVANALHDLGHRAESPFLAVSCAALSPDTFEAEMFGTEGGHVGRLANISGGTLFLDEICACPLPVQAKLLRVLEEKTIFPRGAEHSIDVDFRVVSSTNENLENAVAEGRLRQDLLFRLNTVVLGLPPLRHRREDLLLLATHFVREFSRSYDMPEIELSPEDIAALLAHDWNGNVRELRNVIERLVLASRRGGGSVAEAIRSNQTAPEIPATLREAVAAFERELIGKALQTHGGQMDATASALGIGRRTLNEKIVKLGLNKSDWL